MIFLCFASLSLSRPILVEEEEQDVMESDDPVYLVTHNHAALAAVHATNQIRSVRVGKDIFSMEVI